MAAPGGPGTPAGAGPTGYRDFPAGGLTDRARAWLDAGRPDGPAPRLAATVALLRDGADGVEVFCLERVASMAFAPSMLVFPGGGVDPRDGADAHLAAGWAQALGLGARPVPSDDPADPAWEARPEPATDEAAGSVVVAAVRELFEETGVLLASPLPAHWRTGSDTGPVDGPVVDGPRLTRERARLDAKECSLGQVLDTARLGPAGARLPRRTLLLRGDLLVPVARWVTPHFEARRYDTFFFRAAVPAGQEPDGATTEAASARWVGPADALAAHARGEVRMLPPTIAAMEDLAHCPDVATALAPRGPLALVAPEPVETADGVVIRVQPW